MTTTNKKEEVEEDPRQKLLQLQQKQKDIEDEIEILTEQLNRGRGLTGGLVDNEGFPVGDYGEIVSTRTQRNRLAILQTDYKELMKEVEQQLHLYHAHLRLKKASTTTSSPSSSPSPPITPTSSEGAQTQIQRKPIAVVGFVASDSTAERSGLLVHDLVLSFGSVTAETIPKGVTSLSEISREASVTAGKVVEVTVRRDREEMKLQFDRTSSSTLGCRLDPIS